LKRVGSRAHAEPCSFQAPPVQHRQIADERPISAPDAAIRWSRTGLELVARRGKVLVRRTGAGRLQHSRCSAASSVSFRARSGATVRSMVFFHHGINMLPALHPDARTTLLAPNVLYHAHLRSFDSCPQGQIVVSLHESARNQSESLYNWSKEAEFVGGEARFSNRALHGPCGSAPLARL
jgi:hypothetical protein